MLKQPCTCILCSLVIREVQLQAGAPPCSEFLSLFRISEFFSVYLADCLSHLGKWVRLTKFEAEYKQNCTWKVDKPQNDTPSPSFYHVHVTK